MKKKRNNGPNNAPSKSKQCAISEDNNAPSLHGALTMWELLKKWPQSMKDVRERMGISRRTCTRYASILKSHDLIVKIGYGVWEAKGENPDGALFSDVRVEKSTSNLTMGAMRPLHKINLHALTLECPVLSGTIDLEDWGGYGNMLRGWRAQYKRIAGPIGMTWRNNNNKTFTIFVWSRNIVSLGDVFPLATRALIYTYEELKKRAVHIDIMEYKVKNLHVAVTDEQADKILNKGGKVEIDLGRDAANLEAKASAWVDSSPFNGVESNDLQYIADYLKVPEQVKGLVQGQAMLGEMLRKLPVDVTQPMYETVMLSSSFQTHLDVLEFGDEIRVLPEKDRQWLSEEMFRRFG